ncbi:hypothetical protein F4811DRAFT_536972 [Daldinia bambusicola]|nr:hypothetical protein F4811DRAFT_536972 [Daldinia bambusicola]
MPRIKSRFRFSSLPTELRWQIWKDALEEEIKERIVVVDTHGWGVCPMRRHASPLFVLNRESRELAKVFYPSVVQVYYTSGHHLYSRKAAQRRGWKESGILCLNLERDIFVLSENWNSYSIGRYRASSPCADFKLFHNYTTSTIVDSPRLLKPMYFIRQIFFFEWLSLRPFTAGECCWFSQQDRQQSKTRARFYKKISPILKRHMDLRSETFALWNPSGHKSIGIRLQDCKTPFPKPYRPPIKELSPGPVYYLL